MGLYFFNVRVYATVSSAAFFTAFREIVEPDLLKRFPVSSFAFYFHVIHWSIIYVVIKSILFIDHGSFTVFLHHSLWVLRQCPLLRVTSPRLRPMIGIHSRFFSTANTMASPTKFQFDHLFLLFYAFRRFCFRTQGLIYSLNNNNKDKKNKKCSVSCQL